MKRFRSVLNLMLALTLLTASISVAAMERPFSANGSGVAEFIFNEAGQVIGANISGSGNATHLGGWTNVGQITFTPHPTNPNLVIVSGESTFTASDGDKLNFIAENASMDLTTGVATGQFRWIGGTGRFENASGVASAVVQQNFVSGGWELTVVGSIDY